jgi:hypothetical protein
MTSKLGNFWSNFCTIPGIILEPVLISPSKH